MLPRPFLALYPLLKRRLVDPKKPDCGRQIRRIGRGEEIGGHVSFSGSLGKFSSVQRGQPPPCAGSGTNSVGPNYLCAALVSHEPGILAVAYGTLKKKMTTADVRAVFQEVYGREYFIRLLPEGQWPQTRAVAYTNFCDINVKVDERNEPGHCVGGPGQFGEGRFRPGGTEHEPAVRVPRKRRTIKRTMTIWASGGQKWAFWTFFKRLFGKGGSGQDRVLKCVQCGRGFMFEAGEQEFYKRRAVGSEAVPALPQTKQGGGRFRRR